MRRVSWFGLSAFWPDWEWVPLRSNRRPTFAIGWQLAWNKNPRFRLPPLLCPSSKKASRPPLDPTSHGSLPRRWLLIALVSFVEYWRYQEVDRQQQIVASARNEAARFQAQLDQQAEKLQELEQIRDALSAPESRVIFLVRPGAYSANFRHYRMEHKGKPMAGDREPAAASSRQGLSAVVCNPFARVSAGLIQPDSTGRGFAVVQVPSEIGKIAAAAITLEPAGGSPQPTLPIYALGKIG